jgi:para-aminobenzoate synthetase component 1
VVARSGLLNALARLKPGELAPDEVWAGYFGYELGQVFEDLPSRATNDLQLPVIAMSPTKASTRRAGDIARITQTVSSVRSTFTRQAYLNAVARSIDYIRAGDIFQVNLSQRFAAPLLRSPTAIFDHLLRHFPAPYPAYLDFGDHQVISNSPELFLRVDRLPDGQRRIINRPIKGTRPRAPGMESELELSEKDRAELAMIVDLQRNDLGRICQIGTVQVTVPRQIETHPTVYHGVATIEGILREEVNLTDILKATFPCGSVTGCPKIRAMQIIDELEPVRRGVYCGAIGWIGPGGTMEMSVAIRTMTIADDRVYIPVGGGIVADSTPEAEYAETLVKSRALFAAAGINLDEHDPAITAR